MLNVDQFYGAYGQILAYDEYLEVEGKQVLARPDRIFVLRLENEDPFNWLSQPFDGTVFKTNSGYLAIVAIFDAEHDETATALNLCERLVGVVQ